MDENSKLLPAHVVRYLTLHP